jgi:hypothetical protein
MKEKSSDDEVESESDDLQSETITQPRRSTRSTARQGITRLEPSMQGKTNNDKNSVASFIQMEMKENKEELKETFPQVVNVCFTQMSANKGIKAYGKKAVATMLKEYKQLHEMAVFAPQNHNDMTLIEKRALRAVNSFI